jgi:hypothetical protein
VGAASGHTYNFTRRPDALTDIDVDVVRDGKTLKGHFLGLVLGTIGKGVLEKAFKNSVKAIEARNGAAREAGAAILATYPTFCQGVSKRLPRWQLPGSRHTR